MPVYLHAEERIVRIMMHNIEAALMQVNIFQGIEAGIAADLVDLVFAVNVELVLSENCNLTGFVVSQDDVLSLLRGYRQAVAVQPEHCVPMPQLLAFIKNYITSTVSS